MAAKVKVNLCQNSNPSCQSRAASLAQQWEVELNQAGIDGLFCIVHTSHDPCTQPNCAIQLYIEAVNANLRPDPTRAPFLSTKGNPSQCIVAAPADPSRINVSGTARAAHVRPALAAIPPQVCGVIAEEIYRQIVASRQNGAVARTHRMLADILLWVWTADAYDPLKGTVKRDGFKYACDHQRHTEAAHEVWLANGKRGTGLIHEHAAPRKEILDHLFTSNAVNDSAGVLQFLEKWCFAVIVTKAENSSLPRSMPAGWVLAGNPLARYNRLPVFDESGQCLNVQRPRCRHC